MTAVYCTSACGSLVAALDTAVVTSVPDEFEELVRDCSSGVVVCPDPDQDRAFFRWLRRLVRRPSTPPIVAVAPFAPRFISALAPIAIADIVRPADVPTDLRNRLAELARPDPWAALDDLARRAATALPWLPAHLIDLLCDVRRPPITRVGGIQALLGVSHSTIRRVWNTYFPGAGPPKRLVDWVLLLRTLAMVRRGRNVIDVAVSIGIHETTLERLSMRLTGRSFVANTRETGFRRTVREFSNFTITILPAQEKRTAES